MMTQTFETLVTELAAGHNLGRGEAATVAARLRPDLAAVHQAELDRRPAPASAAATTQHDDDAQHEWERDAALRAEFGNDKARYLAFRAATDSGRARISIPRAVRL